MFFSESAIRFFKSPKKIFQKTILSLKFKFQVQDSFLEYIFLEIWRFEKHIALSEKKPPLAKWNPFWISEFNTNTWELLECEIKGNLESLPKRRKSFNLEKLRPTYVVVSWLETFLLLLSKMHQSLQNWQKTWIRGQKLVSFF